MDNGNLKGKVLQFANANLASGSVLKALGDLHFSDPHNACVAGWPASRRYCMWGQIGYVVLKSVPDLLLTKFVRTQRTQPRPRSESSRKLCDAPAIPEPLNAMPEYCR